MSPAAELRQAAETLRERAKAATPGPWVSDPAGAWTGRVFGTGVDGAGTEMVAKTSTDVPDDHSDAAYIATMHPGVGLALADWLDKAGADWFAFGDEDHHRPEHEPCSYCDDDPYGPHLRSALSVARLINGGAS